MNEPDTETATQANPDRLSLASENPGDERLHALRKLFPEAFTEGKVDFERLREALGDSVDAGPERYGLSWAGKSDSIRAIQTPSTGTLLPDRERSLDFDDAQNVMIEGENLEVLKLLQKSYYGKVKLIYIDPPYNTGKEFVYSDNYRDGLREYLRLTGQVDEDNGARLTTNPETSGRYHSRWLSMMYPRLFLARNLLLEDGVIFVSIDDTEVHDLRLLMDELFGPENFIATVIWQKVYSPKNTARHFSEDHDFVVVYAKDANIWRPALLPRTEEMEARYSNPDEDPRGPWKPGDISARNYYGAGTYSVTSPSGRRIAGPPDGRYWSISKEKFESLDDENRIWWGAEGNNMPAMKQFLSEVKDGRVPQTLWMYDEVGHTQEAKKELLRLVDFSSSESVFHTPKPTRLIERMLRLGTSTDEQDIVLDFFAGSGTTGEAVMRLNAEDGGDRRFLLVQFPEPIEDENHVTIADVTIARLTAASSAIRGKVDEQADAPEIPEGALAFKTLRLSGSNFRIWDADEIPRDEKDLAEQLRLYADHLLDGRSSEDVLYELMLKSGFPLTASIEERTAGDGAVWFADGGELAICLDDPVSAETLEAIVAMEPRRVLCLDRAFHGNDALKTNAVLQMRDRGIEFRTV